MQRGLEQKGTKLTKGESKDPGGSSGVETASIELGVCPQMTPWTQMKTSGWQARGMNRRTQRVMQ